MRRSDREITNKSEIIDIIKKCKICRLAFNDSEFPYIVPLNFGFIETNNELEFYFHCANEGKKLDLIQKNPHAFFEMDAETEIVSKEEIGYCTMNYESVMGKGIIEILDDDMKKNALNILCNKYHPNGFKYNENALKATTVFKLKVLEYSAKRHKKQV